MKIYENTHTFLYPWDQVTAANWRKYPNDISTHVVAVDVLRREVDPVKRELTTERLITCKQSIPQWLIYLVGGKKVSYVREVSVVNLEEKTLTLRSVNLTMSNLLKVFETVTYSPDVVDPAKTIFKQEAQITAYAAITRLCNKLEEWGLERFGENAKKGQRGFDLVLKIFSEKWDKKDSLVDEIVVSLDKVVKSVDHSIDSVVKTVDSSIEIIRDEIVKETDCLLSDADHVKKSLLHEYLDLFKAAFRRSG